MKRPEDDFYTSRLAANIAAIYLERGDLGNGRKYLDIALDYHKRSRIPETDSHLFGVLARYHALRGDRLQSAACLDSTLRAMEREQEAFSGLVLRQVEQQLRAADRKEHEQRLGAEKIHYKLRKA